MLACFIMTDSSLQHVAIYTDGACSPNPGTGGWGAVLISQKHKQRKELSGAEVDTTNNRMELQAAIEGQGVALGRRALVANDLAAGRLVRPFDLGLPLAFSHWLVYPSGADRQPKIRAFRDWITAEAQDARASKDIEQNNLVAVS